ncbi:MAG TPA: acetyl-CoA C-acyltransferase [Egibacteraceae bacterium]|nr:acetyl-CoA C-acyltransferase [Egibacteraceae bacterium]
MSEAVIVGWARTPIGKFGRSLAPLTAMQLGGAAIAGALERTGITGDQVDSVIMGHVLQAGQGQITARQAAVKGGIPMTVDALTVNKVCLSGMAAVALADQAIKVGHADVIVAGGMESMSNAAYVTPTRSRDAAEPGELIDSMIHDGLWCAFDDCHMGASTDAGNAKHGITRSEQDEWAAESHERALAAWKEGRFAGEVVPVVVPAQGGEERLVEMDEGMRPGTTPATLAELTAAFAADGTITAGNASQISDGAAALVLASRERADALGLRPLGRIIAYGSVAGPDALLHHQPAGAIERAAQRAGLDPAGLDLYEINEAFASVAIHSARALGVEHERVNVNGGAVALGHPIGCTGARITLTLLAELARRGGGRGAAALCGGGGQGDALILETV